MSLQSRIRRMEAFGGVAVCPNCKAPLPDAAPDRSATNEVLRLATDAELETLDGILGAIHERAKGGAACPV